MWNCLLQMDLVIFAITACAVILCMIICWCLSFRNPDVVPQMKVPEGAGYLQGVALRRSQAPEFYDFIQNVINLFNGQRLRGDQFAVLIFTAESELNRMGSIRFQDPWCTTRLVNRTHPYFPRNNLNNYLVARPDMGHHVHCEKILLDQEYWLWDAYEEDHPTGPRCIILYSWLLPCSDCTRKIITYHTHTRPVVKLIVVFTSGCYQDELENLNNITRMQEAGIEIHKVSYSRHLPPC